MLRTLEGVFENGSIELGEDPPNVRRARVLVTFLPELTAREVESVLAARKNQERLLDLIQQLRQVPDEDPEGTEDFDRFQREHPIRFRSLGLEP